MGSWEEVAGSKAIAHIPTLSRNRHIASTKRLQRNLPNGARGCPLHQNISNTQSFLFSVLNFFAYLRRIPRSIFCFASLHLIMESEHHWVGLLATWFSRRHLSAVRGHVARVTPLGPLFHVFKAYHGAWDKAGVHLRLWKGTESFCSQQWSNRAVPWGWKPSSSKSHAKTNCGE